MLPSAAVAVATVFTDSDEYPSFADLTGSLVYARLMRTQPDLESGYPLHALDRWVERACAWMAGDEPDDLPRVESAAARRGRARDVYLFFISGAKERAPAAAMALLERLARGQTSRDR